MLCSKVAVFLKLGSIAQVHVTAASWGWVIDWDRLLVIFVQSNSFISELQNASSSPRSHQGDQGGAEEVVVTVVRRQLLISTPVLHCMAHATSSISAEQVPSILTFFAGFFDWIVEFGDDVWCCDEAVKNMWQNPYSLRKNLDVKGKIIIFASNYELW